MPFPYKNPISPIQVLGPQSVNRTVVFGTHFSTNGTGGFMEVFSLSGLTYEIPVGQTGSIEYSGNTIPINFIKGTGVAYSPDVLILNSDNISSGRRKLGMLTYVYELDQVYQYDIPNYEQLWTAATASTNCVFINEFGTTVRNNTIQGQAFINAWTASTIEGVNGVVRSNARWKKYWGNNLSVTGGSYNGVTNTLTLVNITGGTVDISGFVGGGGGGASFTGGTFNQSNLNLLLTSTAGTLTITGVTGLYISGGSYSSGNTTLSLSNSTGGTLTITGFSQTFTGGTVLGATNFTGGLTANTISATTISATTYLNLPVSGLTEGNNISITGANGNFTISFTGTTGGGGGAPITGGTFNQSNLNLQLVSTASTVTISGVTGLYISAGTYSSATTTLSLSNSTGGTISITGFSQTFSGGSGNCINQLFLNEIYPCTSDIKIQPLSTGRVYFGSLSGASGFTVDLVSDTVYETARLGLNNTLPEHTIDFYSRDRKNRLYLSDNLTNLYNFSNNYTIGDLAQFVISDIYDDVVLSWTGTSITLYNSSGDSVTKTLNNVFFNSPSGLGLTRLAFGGLWAQDYSLSAGGYFVASVNQGDGQNGTKNLIFSGDSDTNSSFTVSGPNRSGVNGFHGISMGIRGYTTSGTVLNNKFGVTGDSFIQVFAGTNGLNIINETGTGTDDYIRLYAGQNFIDNVPDIHIQGSGTTRGYVGINITGVTNTLHVSAATNPVRFEGLQQSALTRYLVADTNGVVYFTTGVTSGSSSSSSGFTTISITGTTQFTSTDLQTINFSGINISITSGVSNTLVFSASTGNTVTISGGTGIEVIGSYPNFGVNFTGSTTGGTVSGDYLPLSGGTVSGATNFTGGLTANTISATTYLNLPVSGLTEGNNISITGANGNFTISFTGTTGGGGFSAVSINNNFQFNATSSQTINFSGINISITSGISANTLIFSAGTGAPAITGGTFDPTNLELDLTSSEGTVTISGVTGLYISGGSYTSGNTTLTLSNSTGGTITITGFSRTFSGGSGNCINQLYLNEIYPCTSDIKIQPLSEGKVFFGSLSGASGFTVDLVLDTVYETARLGLNNSLPEHTIDFYSRDRKNRLYLSDNLTNIYNVSNTYVISSLAQFVISDIYDDVVLSWIGTSITIYNSSGESVTKTLTNVFFNSPSGLGLTRLFFGGTWAQDYSLDAGGYFVASVNQGDGQNGTKNLIFSGDSDTNSSLTVSGPNRSGVNGFHGISMGIRGYTTSGTVLNNQVGVTGDSFIQVFAGTNGLNIINEVGTDTDDYIRFYAGRNFIDNIPDIHIQGSGTTRGYVGINITGVTNQLHVSAATHPVRFEGLVSSANTRFLVANTDGVVTYTTSSPGGEGTGFSAITINNTSQFNSSSSQVLNFSGINITITSAATNTLVFSAGTGGGGGVTSITAGYGVSANTSTGNVTIIQVFDYGKAYTTGNNLNFL